MFASASFDEDPGIAQHRFRMIGVFRRIRVYSDNVECDCIVWNIWKASEDCLLNPRVRFELRRLTFSDVQGVG